MKLLAAEGPRRHVYKPVAWWWGAWGRVRISEGRRGAGVHCRKGRQRQGIQNSEGEGKRKNSPGRFSEALAVRNVGRGFGKHARTACGQGQKGWGKPWGVWCMELRSRRGSMRRNGARGRVGEEEGTTTLRACIGLPQSKDQTHKLKTCQFT